MSSHPKSNPSQKQSQDAAVIDITTYFSSALDCSRDVDGTVPVVEHMFELAKVVPLLPRTSLTTEGTPCLAPATDASRPRLARNSPGAVGPSGPARPNTEQADGLKSPGAPMPLNLPTGTPAPVRKRAATAAPPRTGRPSPPAGALTGERSTDVGTLAHWLVGQHADDIARHGLPADLPGVLESTAYRLIDAIPARRRVLSIKAVSLAHRYLHSYVPETPWVLMRAEYDCGRGRVDLSWRNFHTGQVFFDEVKTGHRSRAGSLPAAWVAQATRYSAAGRERFGDAFMGTRLVSLHGRKEVVLVSPEGVAATVSPTASAPVGEWEAR
jgi:hypothetical protein